MDRDKEIKTSHLFLVRLWLDDGTDEEQEYSWYGKVQHVATGKAASFSNQASMMLLFASMFSSSGAANTMHSKQVGVPESSPHGPDEEAT